jgi:hypothetical protein
MKEKNLIKKKKNSKRQIIQQFLSESGICTCMQEMRSATYKISVPTLHYVQLPRYPYMYEPAKKEWYVKTKQDYSVFKRIWSFATFICEVEGHCVTDYEQLEDNYCVTYN